MFTGVCRVKRSIHSQKGEVTGGLDKMKENICVNLFPMHLSFFAFRRIKRMTNRNQNEETYFRVWIPYPAMRKWLRYFLKHPRVIKGAT